MCYDILATNKVQFMFDLTNCSQSMFTPCAQQGHGEISLGKGTIHDLKTPQVISEEIGDLTRALKEDGMGLAELITQRPTSVHSLNELQHVKVRICKMGISCDVCCKNNKATCKEEFFPYINNCRYMKEITACSSCEMDLDFEKPAPTLANKHVCKLSSRVGKMTCGGADNNMERVCPCA